MKIICCVIFCALFICPVAQTAAQGVVNRPIEVNYINKTSIKGIISLKRLLDINQDMNKLHDARPKGVPTGYDWAKGPRNGAGNNPGLYSATTGWGQIFWVNGAKINSDRIEVRNFKYFICHGSEHNWTLLQQGGIEGKQFRADYVNNSNNTAEFFEEKDGVATIAFDTGSAFHFWPKQGRVTLPSKDVCGVLVLLEARLSPKYGTIDNTREAFLIGLGADYWEKLNSKWSNFRTNTDVAIGRLKFVSNGWTWYGMSTASDLELRRLYQNGYELRVNGNMN